MVAKVNTIAFQGIKPIKVETQVHFSNGVASISVVGLGDKAVAESRERIRAAFSCMGYPLPYKKIVVNLAPADLIKEGSHYDLPIAAALLIEAGIIEQQAADNFYFIGELSLDSSLNAVNGALPAAIEANSEGMGLICPHGNAAEAAWSGNPKIYTPKNLTELINHLKDIQLLSPATVKPSYEDINYPDIKDIKGQINAKRALEVAAAGAHNLLMIGPPGSGKSMLAKRLPSILPPMNAKEMLEVSIISSIAGTLKEGQVQRNRPFRDPHSSSSMPAIVGGGKNAKPGEITLAHNGVLFLDELPEYSRNVLESLRQPIESGSITIARVNSHLTYPARFQLIAAMNPCKCGNYADVNNGCNRMNVCAIEYQSKISGPLMDRFDIRIEVPAVNIFEATNDDKTAESSQEIRNRVENARNIQASRYEGYGITLNSQAEGELLNEVARLDDESMELIKKAVDKFSISMRGYNRIIRVARTIADLQGAARINKFHLAEAINFRIQKTATV